MMFKMPAESLLAVIISFAASLSGYFLGIVSFPELSNEQLNQTLINLKTLTIITCAVFFLLLLYPAIYYGIKKYAKWFWIAGVFSLFVFFIAVFKLYFPFENKYVIHSYECDTTGNTKFLIGKEFNSEFLKHSPDVRNQTIENLILGTGCRPHIIWTAKSIERNYNTLISYYIICIFLFTSMIFLLLQAVLCQMRVSMIKSTSKSE